MGTGTYVQLGAVKTWYDEQGTGEPLVLLHGGMVDSRWFEPNLAALAEHFHVYPVDMRGHGHTPDPEGPYTFQALTDDAIAFLETVIGGPADLLGHSMGAFVFMQVAMQRPDLVNRLVMISGGFSKHGDVVQDGEWDIDAMEPFLGPAYAEVSPDGPEHFRVLATKVGELNEREPYLEASELSAIQARSLIMFADDDLSTFQHAIDMYDAIPNAELAIVPGTSHFLTQEKPELVNRIVLDFLTKDPVSTVAPVRRRPAEQS
jgi:pimeloyl-ACP methyl ester carboxylesterase